MLFIKLVLTFECCDTTKTCAKFSATSLAFNTGIIIEDNTVTITKQMCQVVFEKNIIAS